MSRKRFTDPGLTDCHWMSVTCTPELTHVEFHDHPQQAEDAARGNLVPTVSTYVGQVTKQGEHLHRAKRGGPMVVAFSIELDQELLRAISRYNGARSRESVQATLSGLLRADLIEILGGSEAKDAEPDIHDEVTVRAAGAP